MTKRSSQAVSGRTRRGAVTEGYKVVALFLKPSLGLFGLVGRCRILLPHPGSTTGHLILPGDHLTLQHIQVHFGVNFQADFEDVRWHDVALTWNHTKDLNRSRTLCFLHPVHVLVIRGNSDLHFEGAGNDPVVISWICWEHGLYRGVSPISLVEHCVTFRHDRRLLSLSDLTDKMKRSFFQAAVTSILLYGCTTWTLTKRLEKKLDGNYTRMLRAILNKSWQQHPTRHQLYGHLPPITKTIQVRRARHAGHCWKSRDELIRDVLLWIPTHGCAKAGRPARTYIQQLCEDTGCCPEDLPRAMNDREEWRERVRDISATSAIWWWWWWWSL